MLQSAVELYKASRELHEKLYVAINELTPQLRACQHDIGELADAALVLDKCQKLSEDSEKECRKLLDTIKKAICVLWAQIGDGSPVRTWHVTASPSVKFMVPIPSKSKEPERFEKVMRGLNVPEALWNKPDTKAAVVPNWPGMIEYVTELLEKGLPLPDGLDETKKYAVYQVRLTGQKEITAVQPDGEGAEVTASDTSRVDTSSVDIPNVCETETPW